MYQQQNFHFTVIINIHLLFADHWQVGQWLGTGSSLRNDAATSHSWRPIASHVHILRWSHNRASRHHLNTRLSGPVHCADILSLDPGRVRACWPGERLDHSVPEPTLRLPWSELPRVRLLRVRGNELRRCPGARDRRGQHLWLPLVAHLPAVPGNRVSIGETGGQPRAGAGQAAERVWVQSNVRDDRGQGKAELMLAQGLLLCGQLPALLGLRVSAPAVIFYCACGASARALGITFYNAAMIPMILLLVRIITTLLMI